jgi:hypothetical protein
MEPPRGSRHVSQKQVAPAVVEGRHPAGEVTDKRRFGLGGGAQERMHLQQGFGREPGVDRRTELLFIRAEGRADETLDAIRCRRFHRSSRKRA